MKTNRKGFTLIELMAALGVTAVIGYFFISIGRDFVIAWDHVGDSVARETEARAAMNTIARDFEAAFFREGTDVMFAVDVLEDNTNSGIWEGDTAEGDTAERPDGTGFDPANHEYGWAGCWVRFFTAAPSLNAVGYQIIRSTIKGGVGTPRYMLYRNVTLIRDTLAEGFDLKAGALYFDNGYIGSIERPNILAVNVIDFGVRLYVYESDPVTNPDPSGPDAPDGLRLVFPADLSSSLETVLPAGGLAYSGATFSPAGSGQRYPDVVEVFIRVLSESGADEISNMEEAGDNSRWQEVVDKNSRLYRRYITISGKGGV